MHLFDKWHAHELKLFVSSSSFWAQFSLESVKGSFHYTTKLLWIIVPAIIFNIVFLLLMFIGIILRFKNMFALNHKILSNGKNEDFSPIQWIPAKNQRDT